MRCLSKGVPKAPLLCPQSTGLCCHCPCEFGGRWPLLCLDRLCRTASGEGKGSPRRPAAAEAKCSLSPQVFPTRVSEMERRRRRCSPGVLWVASEPCTPRLGTDPSDGAVTCSSLPRWLLPSCTGAESTVGSTVPRERSPHASAPEVPLFQQEAQTSGRSRATLTLTRPALGAWLRLLLCLKQDWLEVRGKRSRVSSWEPWDSVEGGGTRDVPRSVMWTCVTRGARDGLGSSRAGAARVSELARPLRL